MDYGTETKNTFTFLPLNVTQWRLVSRSLTDTLMISVTVMCPLFRVGHELGHGGRTSQREGERQVAKKGNREGGKEGREGGNGSEGGRLL